MNCDDTLEPFLDGASGRNEIVCLMSNSVMVS